MEYTDDDVEIIEIKSGSSMSSNSSSRINKNLQTQKRGFQQKSRNRFNHDSSSSSTESDDDFQPQLSKKQKLSQPNISFVVQKKKSSTQSKNLSQREKVKREEEKQRKKEEQDRKRKEKEEEKERKKKEREDAKREKENDPKVLAAKQRKKEKEEKELKKKKETEQHQTFMKNFLFKKPLVDNQQFKSSDSPLKVSIPLFKPFEIKKNMAVSPLHRRQFTNFEKEKLDEEFKPKSSSSCSKDELLSQSRNSKRKWGRTIVNQDINMITTEDGRILEDSQGLTKHKFKLLQFHENKRPAYFGTYKRRCLITGPRRPFAKEQEIEYDYDSDDEFEEEPSDGDSIDEKEFLKMEVHDNDYDEPLNEGDNDILDPEDESTYEGNHVTLNTISVPTIETRNLYAYKLLTGPTFKPFQDDDSDMEEL